MITAILILMVFILFSLSWILMMPAYFIIDTSLGRYEIYQLGIFRIAYRPGIDRAVRLNLFGIPLDMKSNGESGPGPTREKKKQRKTFSRSLDAWLYLQKGLRNSFLLKRFQAAIDTRDPVLNAQLYSVLSFINRGRVHVSVNFIGRNYLNLEIQARVYSICWTIIRFLTKK